MNRLRSPRAIWQSAAFSLAAGLLGSGILGSGGLLRAADKASGAVLKVAGAEAKSEAEMKAYTDRISDSEASFDMVPIRGGTFSMGSPVAEAGRNDDEGPVHEVKIAPFWMGKQIG
ncbi:MAG TPA: SUMF1/EgtB/PvdO family nonheme iron enzyme, partial [Pirellulales bacterium]|nr:SUMF1/EgtB/PvdO family nonheme iron enzyme [Pirellulales bacterium]